MDLIERNLRYFIENHKDIYEAYMEYGKLIHEEGGPLDEKTKRLIKVATSATSQHHYAVKTHIRKALKAGCTKEEIEHAILLIAPTAGFPTAMEAIVALREEQGEEEPLRDK